MRTLVLFSGNSEFAVFNSHAHLLTGSKTGVFNPSSREFDPRVKRRIFVVSRSPIFITLGLLNLGRAFGEIVCLR
jgi:hypothetical protein